jgi:hypothetical protein
MHGTQTLVAEHQRGGHIEMTALQVEIGPADAAVIDGDHRRLIVGRWYVELIHHERFAERAEDHCAASGCLTSHRHILANARHGPPEPSRHGIRPR